jgi:hypothetical protein
MRARIRAAVTVSGLAGWMVCVAPLLAPALAPAWAQAEGTFAVVPGRPDVPVFVNPFPFDARYAVVEGDFGLSRPDQVNPHIVAPGPPFPPLPRRYFFPRSDRRPGYGRLEVVPSPDRPKPPPAPTFFRSWESSSDPVPASTDPPTPLVIQPDVGVGPPGPPDPPGPRPR